MKRGCKAAKLAALLMTVVVLLGTLGTIDYARGIQLRRDVLTQENNVLAAPYIAENTRLVRQINQLNARIETIERVGTRMTVTIFVQCDTNLYERCYPIAQRYDTSCVFVISGDRMVGREGCITLAQYDELLLEGWIPAIALPDEHQAADSYLESLKKEFEALERSFPDAVYLSKGQFTKENTDYLIAKGFKTFLHEYEEEYFEEFDPTMSGEEDPVYIPYLYLAQNKKVFPDYERITSDGECCALATRKVVYLNEFTGNGQTDPLLDSVVSVMGNVFEVVVAEFAYQRTVAEYREETYASYVALAEEKERLRGQIADLQTERKRQNGEIVRIFSAQLDL